MFKNYGFTLIELLVVISIIAILSAVGMTYYNSFLKNSRDIRRQSDLKLIQSALESYRADQFYYPYSAPDCNTNGGFRIGCSLKSPDGGKTYINKLPSDPIGTNDYSYIPQTGCTSSATQNCTTYCLYTRLESLTLTSDVGCSPTSPYTYGVTKP